MKIYNGKDGQVPYCTINGRSTNEYMNLFHSNDDNVTKLVNHFNYSSIQPKTRYTPIENTNYLKVISVRFALIRLSTVFVIYQKKD